MDMLEGGMSWNEICTLAKSLEKAGVSILSTHFSWHESPVPTIATMVPRAAFTSVTKRLKTKVSVPVITSNRINMPDIAEKVLENNEADLISMARPFLADSQLFLKMKEGRDSDINTCIACNQACLDHAFARKEVSMAKNHVADTLHRAVDTALQLNGARGYSKDTPLEWIYRYARQARLVDGASEVHKMVLSRIYRNEGLNFWSWGV